MIPSLRRTDKLGDRFTDEQIDAVLDSVQSFLLGLSQPFANGEDEGGAGDEDDGMVGGGAGGDEDDMAA